MSFYQLTQTASEVQQLLDDIPDKAPKLLSHITKTSSGNLSIAECSQTIINNFNQSLETTLMLPTAIVGLMFTLNISTPSIPLHIKPQPTDKIILDGVAFNDGYKVSNMSPALGDFISFYTTLTDTDKYSWAAISGIGPWINGGV